jgi:fermentation-respiration switch protein FrsA (DUF1100 family)
MGRVLKSVVRVAVGTLVALFISVTLFEHRFIYFPDRKLVGAPSAQYENVFFNAADATRLHGWWLPHPESSTALIVSHGNAGNITYRAPAGDFLRSNLQTNVFMYDYRGYGQSQGEPSEQGTYADIRAAYSYVKSRGFTPNSIFLMGQSLGTAVTVDLAVSEPVAGVILEAPFTSVAGVARKLFGTLPIHLFVRTKYDSLSKIAKIRAPLVIVHATRDPVIAYEFGRVLFEAASQPKLFFEVQGELHEGAIMGLRLEDLRRMRQFLFGKRSL